MSDFRRTHHDNWQEHKQKFTEDQLLVLTDLLVSPCYYAWMALVALNENSTEDSALMSADDNRTVSSAKHVPLVIRCPSDKFQKRIYSSDNICVHDPFSPTIIALCWRSFFLSSFCCRMINCWKLWCWHASFLHLVWVTQAGSVQSHAIYFGSSFGNGILAKCVTQTLQSYSHANPLSRACISTV